MHRTEVDILIRRMLFYAGLHPSQQLTKYDGDVAATAIENDVAQRLSVQGGGDADGTLSDQGASVAIPPTSSDNEPTTASDLNDLYAKPMRVVGRRQGQAEPSDETASYQYGDPSLRARAPSLTGDLTALLFLSL